jgi:hypothetical protein
MLNLYYITDALTFADHVNFFHPQLGAHYIDLPGGKILVSAHFPINHASIEMWESHPNVEALPHPVFEGSKPLTAGHVSTLASIGVKPGHTVLDVATRAAAIHPLMKLRHF